MKTTIALILTLAACTDSETPVTEHCGAYPSSGHYTVTYVMQDGQPVAVLPRADFEALTKERSEAKEWAYCAAADLQVKTP